MPTVSVHSKSGCQLRLKNQWSPLRVKMLKLKDETTVRVQSIAQTPTVQIHSNSTRIEDVH